MMAPKEMVPWTCVPVPGVVMITAAEVGAGVGTVVGFGVAAMVGVEVGVGLTLRVILRLCSAMKPSASLPAKALEVAPREIRQTNTNDNNVRG
jgi:hypothetical protein